MKCIHISTNLLQTQIIKNEKIFEITNVKELRKKYRDKKIGLAHGTFDFFTMDIYCI